MATESGRVFRGVVIVDARRARELRNRVSPIQAGELIGCSGDFRAGDWLHVAARGQDGGQSVLAIGAAVIDSGQIGNADAQALVVDALELLWRSPAG